MLESLVSTLRAVADPTRVRLLMLLGESELSVSELTRILGQSQPRVSRHLKLLFAAGLLERHQEGSWVHYRTAQDGRVASLLEGVFQLMPSDEPTLSKDRARLASLRAEREARAAAFFTANAARWDKMRSKLVDEATVESAIVGAVQTMTATTGPAAKLVDLGTGTGRMLELLAPHIESGTGIDTSHEMLSVARAKLEQGAIRHCQVRRANVYDLPMPPASADLVTIHHVLHFLEHPQRAIEEASALLRPGGFLLIVDYARHGVESLRSELHHRRLGFDPEELNDWCREAGLQSVSVQLLEAPNNSEPNSNNSSDDVTLDVLLLTAARPELKLVDGNSDKEVA